MKTKIVVDAGHYGTKNVSPVVPDYCESKQMWKLQELLVSELKKYGFDPIPTRKKQTQDLEVTCRGKLASDAKLFVSLHSNAVPEGGSEKTDHVSVYAPYDGRNDSHRLAGRLAACVAELMCVKGYVKTRKSAKGDWEYYGVLRGASSVGCPLYFILEHSFHTNKNSCLWLLDDNNLKKLAVAEAAVIADWFGMKKVFGDVNGNGDLDSGDYFLLKRAILGTVELSEEETDAADVNGDGKINITDYTMIKRAFLKK